MKYIDADKLLVKIKGLQCEQGFEDGEAERGYQLAIKDILDIIKQEQVKNNIIKEDNKMDSKTLFNILTGQYGEILETHAMWECISALGIKPFKDGNQWCFLYGENIQEGVCGFGDTIYKAAWDFYTNVKVEEIARKK